MGQLVNGVWHDTWYDTASHGGKFVRSTAKFRNWITPDGSPGPSGEGGFAAAGGRYHLYVAYACPWAHRALIFRALKGLTDHIGVSVVHPDMLSEGWEFRTDFPGTTGDRLYGLPFARDIYLKADPEISGRVTVPILWDTERETIVSNESSEIIRMFNSAFDGITGNTDDYWPKDLREAIEPVNARIYDTVNNGVYKAGFATSQEAYDAAVHPLFESLDWLEERLAENRYLMGERLTEGWFSDRVEIFRDGARAFTDATRLGGDISAQLSGPATGAGAMAMALAVYVAPDAEHQRDALRAALPERAAPRWSRIAPDLRLPLPIGRRASF